MESLLLRAWQASSRASRLACNLNDHCPSSMLCAPERGRGGSPVESSRSAHLSVVMHANYYMPSNASRESSKEAARTRARVSFWVRLTPCPKTRIAAGRVSYPHLERKGRLPAVASRTRTRRAAYVDHKFCDGKMSERKVAGAQRHIPRRARRPQPQVEPSGIFWKLSVRGKE